MDKKTFNTKLAGLIRSAKNQREKIQALIVAGLEHYSEHGDTGYLSKLMTRAIGVKSIPTNSIKEYIKAHANVKLVKVKGEYVFKKEGKEVEVTIPTVVWYEHETSTHNAKPDMDVLARVKSLTTQLNKAIKEGHIKDGQEDEAKAILATLSKYTKAA